MKRYGCAFKCLFICALYQEVARSLKTVFLQVFRRFISKSKPQQTYSDNNTNLVGAEKILRDSLQLWNQSQIHYYLRQYEV